MTSETEEIRLARHGDQAAWEKLAHRHQEAVFRLAYLLLGDPDEAQDIAQETFIRAFHHLGRFDPARPPRPWLLRIASNLTRNRQRANGRYFAALGRFARSEPQVDGEKLNKGILQREDSQAVWQAIRHLKPVFQETLYMRYFLELSETEMAEALDVATGTVKSRLHRAAQRLREVIERDFPELKDTLGT